MPELPISPEAAIAVCALVAALLIATMVRALRAKRHPAPGEREAPRLEQKPQAQVASERVRGALAKTRDALRRRLADVFGGDRGLDAILASLEEVLLAADVGMPTTTRILAAVRARCGSEREPTEAKVREALRVAIEESLGEPPPRPRTGGKPWVILVSGVNGVGKTTSIGKLAARFAAAGNRVLLVAADTFRAAAIDQLGVWAERVGADLVRHQSGADPAAVAFDGVKAAAARGVDVVIVDTAGRLHTRENLMEELRKMTRVIGKAIPGAPHETWLVLDATTGQNAIHQAKVFSEALGVTGIVVTKLDGTAKGGAALAVREELGVPIVWLGVGEGVEDIRPFSAAEFATALVGED
jgi:fused signal recognition particle receptor